VCALDLECFAVIARERSDEAIQTKPRQDRYGLLRVIPENQSERWLSEA